MLKRRLGPFQVNPVGLGCMSLSHAYGTPPPREDAVRLLGQALDLGYDHLDTAALYGFGANETLIGQALSQRRNAFVLASKCGMTGVAGKRVIDGRPDTLLRTVDEALGRLRTDVIDLYYLHRWDRAVPIEDSVGALARMVEAGKIRSIGLSEVSASTIRRAHAVHPLAAVQNEYSPWSRNVELGVLATTRELGIALVAFSPVARGFLAGAVAHPEQMPPGDIRRGMPRFQPGNVERNLHLYRQFAAIAAAESITPAQLSLAWVLSRGEHVLAIPGTTSIVHAEENAATPQVSDAALAEVTQIFSPEAVSGPRYPAATQTEIDTEEFLHAA